MLEPTEAVKRIEPSATMKLGDAAKAMKMGGMDIVSLVLGEPDFPTPPHVSRAAKKALDAHVTHYTPGMGIPELRYAVARKYSADNNIPAKPENVMITPTKFGIFASVHGCRFGVNFGEGNLLGFFRTDKLGYSGFGKREIILGKIIYVVAHPSRRD